MIQATPKELAVAGLVVLGALTLLGELFSQLDRLNMATATRADLADLPTVGDAEPEPEV